MAFPSTGTKGFKSRADIETYIAAFNSDDFETYFQYYHPDVCIDIPAIPGPKTLKGYYDWAVGHHQIASETLVPHKIILDRDGKFATLESMTEFRGRKGQDRDNFFGWGPITEGTGPVVKMIVFYHLDDAGRITHLEPAGSSLVKRADSQANGNGDATKGRPPGFYTKDHVQTYIELFSSNQFDKTSGFWAPDLKVTLGPTVIQGREDNIKFFESQRAGNVNEKVEPTAITLDESSCALRAVVTFTALRDFPEGYFGMGTETGVKTGQKIRGDYVIFYDLDEHRRAKGISAQRLGPPMIF